MALRTIFWAIALSIPVAGMVIGIGAASYWTIPPIRLQIDGDPIVIYDPEIGFVPRPNSSSTRTDRPDLRYDLHTDRRGARVSARGEQSPEHIDILVVGDSFSWGHGVQNQETFAAKVFAALGATGANLAFGSYGTTQSLQMLRRNRDLAPKLIVYSMTGDQPRRNVAACAPSYYPFCLDYSHVAWDGEGRPYIDRPRSDGVSRLRLQVQAERSGLDPLTWIAHGVDVAASRIALRSAEMLALDKTKQDAALAYLLEQMASTARDMKAELLIPHIPMEAALPPPDILSRSASRLGYRFLDLSYAFTDFKKVPGNPSLYLPDDGHPSAAGHALIANELVPFIRRENLLSR